MENLNIDPIEIFCLINSWEYEYGESFEDYFEHLFNKDFYNYIYEAYDYIDKKELNKFEFYTSSFYDEAIEDNIFLNVQNVGLEYESRNSDDLFEIMREMLILHYSYFVSFNREAYKDFIDSMFVNAGWVGIPSFGFVGVNKEKSKVRFNELSKITLFEIRNSIINNIDIKNIL